MPPAGLYKTRMATLPPSPAVTAPQVSQPAAMPGKRQRWFEVSLVMLVAFSASILGSIYILKNIPDSSTQLTTPRLILGFLNEVTGLLLLGYVLSRSGRRFRDLGLRWSIRDAGLGLLVAGIAYLAYSFGYRALYWIHFMVFGSALTHMPAKTMFGHLGWTAVPYILINPFFEELIVRAYLMTEIIDLTGSSSLAIAVSVALQTSYHIYYGWWIALSLALQFLVFAISYALSRRAFPIIVAHGLFDLRALLQLW